MLRKPASAARKRPRQNSVGVAFGRDVEQESDLIRAALSRLKPKHTQQQATRKKRDPQKIDAVPVVAREAELPHVFSPRHAADIERRREREPSIIGYEDIQIGDRAHFAAQNRDILRIAEQRDLRFTYRIGAARG